MIMVSTSGPDTAALSYVLDYINVPKGQWTRFAYALTGVVPPNSNIHFAFRYLHFAGGQSGAGSDFVGVDRVQVMRNPATGVGETPATSFELFQNYPNPFNPTTAISYQLSASSFVTLSVYDLMGRNVATLVHETQHPGRHTVQFDGSGLASGVYFYKIQAGWFVQTRKLLLLR